MTRTRPGRLAPLLALALAASLALAACGDGGGGGPGDPDAADDAAAGDAAPGDDAADGGAEDADAGGPPSPLYVRRVEGPEDLIGGPGAYGRVGKAWILGNDVARFLVQDETAAVGLSLYGGNLLDADLARPAGEPGRDAFRETFPLVGFKVLVPTSMTVANDGRAGDEAVLRVEGTLEKSGIVGFLDDLAGDVPLVVALEYVVRPGEPVLTLRTIVTNPGAVEVSTSVGDLLGFGKQLELFTPEAGFAPPEEAVTPSMMATRGKGVSYVYGRASGGLTVPFSDASGTAAFLDLDLVVPPGQTRVLERFLGVGDGSVASVVDLAWERMGAPAGVAAGTVRDAAGEALAGVYVTALAVPAAGGEPTHAANQAVTAADGTWRMRLAPGTYRLVASGEERVRSAPAEVAVAAGEQASADLTLGAHARVDVRFTVEGPQPEGTLTDPVKVSLQALDAEVPDPRLGEVAVAGQARIVFAGPEVDAFLVKPGRYRVVISHGAEYERVVLDDWQAVDGAVLEGSLARVLDTGGFVGCDFHQHTIGSMDANASLEDKLRENLAAGLECAAITDHDNLADMRPVVAALGAGPAFHAVVGNEISVNAVGHFNAYPLPLDPDDPDLLRGAQLWAGRTIQQLFDYLRGLAGERTIQVNHPRSDPFKGYFVSLRLDPWSGDAGKGVLADGFDALEVNAEIGAAASYTGEGWATWQANAGSGVPVLADWFGLLNRGKPVCAVGNSDAHDVGDDAGWPRTYLRVGTDAPGELTDDLVTQAIHEQKAVVSRGAFLHVLADGVGRMGHTEVVDASGGPVTLSVIAEAPPWLRLDTVELYVNGLLVEARATTAPPEGGTVWFASDFELAPVEDAWAVVLTRGPALAAPVFSGFTYAFTNPVYLDVDGDGWTAPGPVALP